MATDRYSAEARKRLGDYVEGERLRLGLSQKAVAGQTETYANLRDGRRVQDKTLRRAEQALGLPAFALVDVLEGRPVREHARGGAERWDGTAHLTTAMELIAGLGGNTPEEQGQILELLERGRRRLDEQRRSGNGG